VCRRCTTCERQHGAKEVTGKAKGGVYPTSVAHASAGTRAREVSSVSHLGPYAILWRSKKQAVDSCFSESGLLAVEEGYKMPQSKASSELDVRKNWCQATVIRYYIKLAFLFASSNLSRFNTIPNGSEKGAEGYFKRRP